MPHTLTVGNLETPFEAHAYFAHELYERMGEGALATMREVVPKASRELERGLALRTDSPYEGMITSEAEHTMDVLEGTGLYGPKHEMIDPPGDTLMVFFSERDQEWVFTQTSKGMHARPFDEWTVDREEPKGRLYARDAAAATRREYGG